jgi:glycosyltransferase involved in cell wall biosynthesis
MPGITVLMPVYNGERHVRAAIDSILAQTYRDFEFVIVDDGSTDATHEVVSSYRDSRIRLVSMAGNSGLSTALNEGLRIAGHALVARQDADDIAEPNRLERQLAVMISRPELGLLGSQAVAISEDGAPTGTVRRSVTPAAIRWFSAFDNPFIHTSVVFRADMVRALGGFNPAYDPFSQDYDLWCRLMESHACANLPERLVRYRVNDSSIIGALDGSGDRTEYQRRFDGIVRELTARQARRIFGEAAIGTADEPLVSGIALGLPRDSLKAFLAMFERLLARYRAQCQDCTSQDFLRTLARQFEALASRVKPATRESAFTIYRHALRHHPELTTTISWPRTLAAVLLGRAGRDRLARWKRRHPLLAKG